MRSNTINAVRLDIDLLKPYIKTIGFIIIIPIIFAAINRSITSGISFAMCFMAMTSNYTFSIAEKNDVNRLYGILPVKKSELVVGKYIFMLLLGLITLMVSLLVQPFVLQSLGVEITLKDGMIAGYSGAILYAIYICIQLPGYYKFGSIKGRAFMYIPIVGFLVTLLSFSKMKLSSVSWISNVLDNPVLLAIIVLLFTIILSLISICISIQILKNKAL